MTKNHLIKVIISEYISENKHVSNLELIKVTTYISVDKVNYFQMTQKSHVTKYHVIKVIISDYISENKHVSNLELIKATKYISVDKVNYFQMTQKSHVTKYHVIKDYIYMINSKFIHFYS